MTDIRILCAENDEPLRKVLVSLMNCALEEHEVTTYTLENGERFLKSADPNKYQLYILGYNLHKPTRYETMRELRRKGDKTPTLLIGHDRIDDLSDCKDIGIVSHLTKTLTIGNLRESLNPLLKYLDF